MREDTADNHAKSHAGQHGDFEVFWVSSDALAVTLLGCIPGWYWWLCKPGCLATTDPVGPFATSQAAFGDRKDQIDGK